MPRVKDKVILITGGAVGMGQTHGELLCVFGCIRKWYSLL